MWFQSVGYGLPLELPVTTEADEEDDGMSDIIQEVGNSTANLSLVFFFYVSHIL